LYNNIPDYSIISTLENNSDDTITIPLLLLYVSLFFVVCIFNDDSGA